MKQKNKHQLRSNVFNMLYSKQTYRIHDKFQLK